MHSEMNVSIIVPVWNGSPTINNTISSLLRQSYDLGTIEIIIVDNGSDDSTREIVRSFSNVHLLEEAKPGSYAARNRGLRAASGEIVAFTDADCIADPNWIKSAVETLTNNPRVGVVAGHISILPSAEGSRVAFMIESELSFRQEDTARRGIAVTANWISRRGIMLDAGGFDETLKSGGDWLLSSHLSNSGYEIKYDPNAIVQHLSRSGVIDLLRKRRRVAGGVWARRRSGIARLVRGELSGGTQRTKKIIRSDALSARDKLMVAPVVALMSFVSIAEFCRLKAGGSPKRS